MSEPGMVEEFKRTDMPRYLIADCKFYTEKNSENLTKLPFITRIPQNIKKGRPGKDTLPDSVLYQIIAEPEPDSEMLDWLRETSACYVIGTNISQEELATQEVIDGYRGQNSVERGFRFLKDPLFFTSSLFLKKPSRISALLMIMVYGIAEKRMRNRLAEQRETLPGNFARSD